MRHYDAFVRKSICDLSLRRKAARNKQRSSFTIVYWTTISNQNNREKIPIDFPLSEANKLRSEITYLQDKNKTKTCIVQTLLENQKVVQDAADSKTFNINLSLYLKWLRQNVCHLQQNIFPLLISFNHCLMIAKILSKSTIFYQLKLSMSTLTWIKVLKARSSKLITQV